MWRDARIQSLVQDIMLSLALLELQFLLVSFLNLLGASILLCFGPEPMLYQLRAFGWPRTRGQRREHGSRHSSQGR